MTVPLTESQRALAASVFKMAGWIAARVGRRWPELRADLRSDAMLAVCHGARNYDGRAKFNTYITQAIRKRLRSTIRDAEPLGFRRYRGRDPLPIPRVEPFDLTDFDILAPNSACADVDDRDAFEVLVRPLPPRTRRILWLRFGEDWTCQEIGREVGLTRQRVRAVIESGLEELREGRTSEVARG